MKKSKKNWTNNKILVLCSMIMILSMTVSFRVYAANHGNSSTAGIIIDGYYDDWRDKPITKITWRNYNSGQHHEASMIKDNDYIYVYLHMNPSYDSPIPIDDIELRINDGSPCILFIRYANSQNTTDWSHAVDLSTLGIRDGLHVFTSYPNNSLGDAAVTVSKSSAHDNWEMRIKISDLEKVMNLKAGTINNASKIELNMPNVGRESVILLGTSTAPVLGIILCIITVIAVVVYRMKKVRSLR